ncbi:hypothetical protein NDU88_001233 [Pleurodeles waltl]|uniref:Reverse transcriptase domain-containing protein n=1 Tax=Pleurodeles waltl TaxID=8319 RepID=A0AAV7KSX3_PLEWA|nr:hypothetical protein NDU88_001232 [Pleurodeles waltl]KAJ1081049.1 hypothetical protein NDU88_001233 [Pleurodeles waltl]
MLLSIDSEKLFDRVHWLYLQTTREDFWLHTSVLFLDRVRDNPEIMGAVFGGEENTLAFNADNVIVTLDDLLKALPAFLQYTEVFKKVLGFRINLSKSQALSFMLPPRQ